jgi:hypothetical protein
VRSVKRRAIARTTVLFACGVLAVGALSGCQTTQDTAATKQLESKRFLEQREAKRAKKQRESKKGGEK